MAAGRGKLREVTLANGWSWWQSQDRGVARAVRDGKFVALTFHKNGQVERAGTNALSKKVMHFAVDPADKILVALESTENRD